MLEAGKYWVGDPCYAFDSSWLELLESADFRKRDLLEAEVDGDERMAFVASGTYGGDGVYPDDAGNTYPVDAGMIGVVRPEEAEISEPYGMRLVEFPRPFTVRYEDGDIVIGHLTIHTGDSDD
jgi:hypothetical protein